MNPIIATNLRLSWCHRLIVISLAAVSVIAVDALAHHESTAFDQTQIITIQGEIRQIRWINPHATLRVNGTASDGTEGAWTIMMDGPNQLFAQGLRRDALVVGDTVLIYANPLVEPLPLSDGSQGALYVGAELADGSVFGRFPVE